MKMLARIAILLTALLIAGSSAADTAVGDLFSPYRALLERHVSEHDLADGGLVSSFDYRGAIADPASLELIARQRERLADLASAEFDGRAAAVAFWANAYNFFMIAHIVDTAEGGEPVESVKDYGSLFNPFRVFTREIFDVAGRELSLDQIEKGILLGEAFAAKGWKDARVHFAVNCASVGCPPLRAEIFTEVNLDRLLDENTRRAMRTPLHLDISGNSAGLSSLFDWYADDFEQASGSIESFIVEHLDDEPAAAFKATTERRFIDYDWRLNSPSNIESWLENRK